MSEPTKEVVIVEKSTPWAGLLSLIFGIISLFAVGVVFGALGFLFGVVALFKGQILLGAVGIVLSLIGFGSSLFFAFGLLALLGIGLALWIRIKRSTQGRLATPQSEVRLQYRQVSCGIAPARRRARHRSSGLAQRRHWA